MPGESVIERDETAKAHEKNLTKRISILRTGTKTSDLPVAIALIGRLTTRLLKSKKFSSRFDASRFVSEGAGR